MWGEEKTETGRGERCHPCCPQVGKSRLEWAAWAGASASAICRQAGPREEQGAAPLRTGSPSSCRPALRTPLEDPASTTVSLSAQKVTHQERGPAGLCRRAGDPGGTGQETVGHNPATEGLVSFKRRCVTDSKVISGRGNPRGLRGRRRVLPRKPSAFGQFLKVLPISKQTCLPLRIPGRSPGKMRGHGRLLSSR